MVSSKKVYKNENVGASSSSKKMSNTKMYMLIGAILGGFVLVSVIVLMMVGGSKGTKKTNTNKTEKTEQVASGNSSGNGTSVNADSSSAAANNSRFDANNGNNPFAGGQQGGAGVVDNQITVYTDPSTKQEMVRTAQGIYPLNSSEGQYYFNQMKQAQANQAAGQLGGVQGNQNQAGSPNQLASTSSEVMELRETTNTQIKALDEKVNQNHEDVGALMEIIRKQNVVIDKLTTEIKTIQPIVRRSTKLDGSAMQQKRTTKEHDGIVVDAISPSGDLVYLMSHDGSTSVLRVGDTIPNTGVKIKRIDSDNSRVN